MQDMTAEELLATTLDVVMYSNTNSISNKNGIRNGTGTRIDYNTCVDNLVAQAPLLPVKAQGPLVRKDQGIPEDHLFLELDPPDKRIDPIGYKRLNTNDKYVEIGVQIGHVRTEGRYMRSKVYISLKNETDKKYSVFLAGAATSCLTELKRGAKENHAVLSTIETMWEEHPGSMIARLHYKPVKCQTTNFHRKLLKHAIINIFVNDDEELEASLYLLDDWISIKLDHELTTKQKEYYKAAGIYRTELEQFENDEELE